ncbi:MAG: SGNH/GDSL hydrolase family protein [Chloroflexota bacterium]
MANNSVIHTVLALILVAAVLVGMVKKTIQAARGDPAFWEWEIRRFERKDRRNIPTLGGIVFTGSSSIRFWKTLTEDMAPLPVVNRGFGGSQIHQVTYYADRIILPYKPKVVVLYAGENDIAGVKFSKKKKAEEVLEAFRNFCEAVHKKLPETMIYFVSIKPPKRRGNLWAEMQRANRLVKEYTDAEQKVAYLDVATAMLDAAGLPRGDLFKWDGLHMKPEGYVIWTKTLKPILEKAMRGESKL